MYSDRKFYTYSSVTNDDRTTLSSSKQNKGISTKDRRAINKFNVIDRIVNVSQEKYKKHREMSK